MRISVKGRYALAAVTSMAENYSGHDPTTIVSLAKRLGLSKIYLEQVFAQLKRGGVVSSVKGAQGGYLLARPPQQITVYDILSATEGNLFETAEEPVAGKAPEIEAAVRQTVLADLDQGVCQILSRHTLLELAGEAARQRSEQAMFYI